MATTARKSAPAVPAGMRFLRVEYREIYQMDIPCVGGPLDGSTMQREVLLVDGHYSTTNMVFMGAPGKGYYLLRLTQNGTETTPRYEFVSDAAQEGR